MSFFAVASLDLGEGVYMRQSIMVEECSWQPPCEEIKFWRTNATQFGIVQAYCSTTPPLQKFASLLHISNVCIYRLNSKQFNTAPFRVR
jgi:hypothetical protein